MASPQGICRFILPVLPILFLARTPPGGWAQETKPSFLRFDSKDGDVFGVDGSAIANRDAVRNRFLAEALPAKMFAAGANRLRSLGPASNFDMNAIKPNGV
jgi:hypothetical protein